MKTRLLLRCACAALLAAGAGSAAAADRPVALLGSPQAADGISGLRGNAITLAADRAGHAVYGLFSVERRDSPCYLAVRTEDLNDAGDKDGVIRNLCGDRGTSRELGAAFEDSMTGGARVFMTGIRVCLNNQRVKGLQIRGKRIDDDGRLVGLDAGQTAHGSNNRMTSVTEPRDDRTNCNRDDEWRRWVECPRADQVVTAIVAHFERGGAPRSLTGIGLQCRQVAAAVRTVSVAR